VQQDVGALQGEWLFYEQTKIYAKQKKIGRYNYQCTKGGIAKLTSE
jgi:hypothetical protein